MCSSSLPAAHLGNYFRPQSSPGVQMIASTIETASSRLRGSLRARRAENYFPPQSGPIIASLPPSHSCFTISAKRHSHPRDRELRGRYGSHISTPSSCNQPFFGIIIPPPVALITLKSRLLAASAATEVGAGFVDSLARPGGNATGFMAFVPWMARR